MRPSHATSSPHRLLPGILSALALGGALTGCGAERKEGPASNEPTLHIAAPRMDQVIDLSGSAPDAPPKAVEVVFDLRNYEIGTVEDGKDGQHLHLILDNEPYVAIYDVTKPIRLDAAFFDKNLPGKSLTEGTHVIRAFPSAGPKDQKGALHHESRKNAGAFAWVRFHVGKRDGPLADWDPKTPLLTYSRPKGVYKAGTPELAQFMVDFYVTNATLGKGDYAVKGTLDGTALGEWTSWTRQVLPTPPAAGDHVLVLELFDRDGKPVPGPFNKTERKFKVTP
jgi:hypothetical protein